MADFGVARDELERIENEVATERGVQFFEALKVMPELIDLLAPEHSKTTCDDTNLQHPNYCSRCALKELVSRGYWDTEAISDFDFSFKFKE